MLDLTKEEAQSLSIVALFCDFKKQYGDSGKAQTFNYKKTSVIRAEWKATRVVDSSGTCRLRMALQHASSLSSFHRNARGASR